MSEQKTVLRIDDVAEQLVGQTGFAEVDLSGADRVDVEVLPYILGVAALQAERGGNHTLNLPEHKNSIDFLRAWRLPEALQQVTGDDFMNQLTLLSRTKYDEAKEAGEPSAYARVLQSAVPRILGRESLLPTDVFSLKAYPIENTQSLAPMGRVRMHWQDAHVNAILGSTLATKRNRVQGIHDEFMRLAVQRHQASMVYATAQSTLPKHGIDAEFITPFWDNGLEYASLEGLRQSFMHDSSHDLSVSKWPAPVSEADLYQGGCMKILRCRHLQ